MKKVDYLKGLDGIRALAILLIVVYHYWPTGNRVLSGGFIGVESFFVISGFIITFILVKEWGKDGRINLTNFWIHRIRRLFPALILMMLAIVFLATVLPQFMANIEGTKFSVFGRFMPDFENELAALKYQTVSGFFYIINWYFIFQGKSYFDQTDRPPLFGHLWSLSIEEQFYLVWPILLILFLKFSKNRKFMAVIPCMFFAIASIMAMIAKGQASPNDARAYFGTDTRIYSLMFGSILALMFDQIKNLANSGRFSKSIFEILGVISLALIIFISFTLEGGELMVFRGGLLCTSIATCFLIVAATCVESSKLSAIAFESSIAKYIGRRSYGLYLWHWPIFILTEPGYNYQIDGIGLLFIRLATLIAITEISFRFIEEPIRKGAIGMIIDEICKERGRKKHKLIMKAGVPALAFIGLAVFCLVSAVNFHSSGIPGLAQAMASESAVIKTAVVIPPEIPKPIKQNSDDKSIKNVSLSEDSKSIKKEDTAKALAIGDSVMLGAKKALEDSIENLTVNAVVSRQFSEIHRMIKKLKKNGGLPPFVIIHAGTNGTIDEKEFIDMMDDLSECRRVAIFNLRVPKCWQDSNNRIINSVVPRYKNAALVDWCGESSRQREVFYKDGIHLKHPKGTMLYVQLAKQALAEK